MSRFDEMRLFSGRAHPGLAEAIADYLQIPMASAEIVEFSNENIFVRLLESVREKDVFIVQPLASPVNRSIMELLIFLDACRRSSAGRITAVIPYFAYGRTDKRDQPRVPITARLLADLIATAGADRVVTLDLHSGQIQGFFSIPIDEITAKDLLVKYFRRQRRRDWVVVSPDVGFAKRARNFAEALGAPLAIVEKRRLGNRDRTEVLNVIGDVEGKRALIVDDEVDTAGSMVQAAEAVLKAGAAEVRAACIHAVLSGDAALRLRESPIVEFVTTNSLPLPPEKQFPQMRVLDVSTLLAETIQRIHTGTSVGELFKRLW